MRADALPLSFTIKESMKLSAYILNFVADLGIKDLIPLQPLAARLGVAA